MFLTFLKQNPIYWKVILGYYTALVITGLNNLPFMQKGTWFFQGILDIMYYRFYLELIFALSFYLFVIIGIINYSIFAFHNYKK